VSVLDIFFPKNCLECSKSGKYICEQCLLKVEPANTRYFNIGELTSINSLWRYEGVVRKAILKLKYNFASDVSTELAEVFLDNFENKNIKKAVLIPVPLHITREKWRGFNQANILGRPISTGMSWEYEQNLLTRKLASKQQVGLAKEDRLRNISGKFAAIAPNEALAKWGEHQIILFDDVWTTGATMREAANTLKRTGFKNIHGLTVCG